MMKRFSAFMLSLLLCLSLLPGAAMAQGGCYDDVPASHWAYDSVESVSESGLMQGYGDRRFGPADQLTVAQVAQILCNARGEETAATNGFWGYGAVERCRDELKCLPDRGSITAVNYDVPVSRELAVYMLVNGMELQPGADASEITLADLPDGSGIAVEYRDAVLTAYRIGLVLGTDAAGTFNPKGLLTRAEGAALFARATDLAAARKPYLTFRSDELFELSTENGKKNWDGVLEYSTDAQTWREWDGAATLESAGNVLYLRGTGNTVISGDFSKGWMLNGNRISCIGNIENLLDHRTVAAGEHPEMALACYFDLFARCTALVSAPEFPATTLTRFCYLDMFAATSLTKAPKLPATTMEFQCYYGMFAYCTSLTSAPELPATTLERSCYSNMFSGCTSLTSAPALPATTLAEHCYDQMFAYCTALTSAPEIPATTLAECCCFGMFRGCTALTRAPKLPAATLASCCYGYMFWNCTALQAAPELPATTLASGCYQWMFSGCTALTAAPELPATMLAQHCYSSMFHGCTSLTSIPELPATVEAQSCYYHMFDGCSSIKLSEMQTDEYTIPYLIPFSEEAIKGSGALACMFDGTGGTFTGTPDVNTTYYLHSSNSIVG